jgi:hypothetical protein
MDGGAPSFLMAFGSCVRAPQRWHSPHSVCAEEGRCRGAGRRLDVKKGGAGPAPRPAVAGAARGAPAGARAAGRRRCK